MIKDKEKVEKIYNYLLALTNAHKSSAYKYHGWSQYNKRDKKHCFSAQLYYRYDESCKNMTVELYDIDFNYKSSFWAGIPHHERIHIIIRIRKDFPELEITKCKVKEGSSLVEFFNKLDIALNEYECIESKLENILLSKGD